jgi:rhamnogalacturonyl hydrolase YesR
MGATKSDCGLEARALRGCAVVMVSIAAIVSAARCFGQTGAGVGAEFASRATSWGDETLVMIDRDFLISEQPLRYAEQAGLEGARSEEPVFMWGAGVQLSALAAAARVDPTQYGDKLNAYADALDAYWVERDGIGGYDVLPVRQKIDRYYDDNAWIVLGMVDAFDSTRDREYLERAKQVMPFVLSGEDDALGGGIYWRENRRNSKNTCSNAPAIVAALLLYQRTGESQYLEDAKRIYRWTSGSLRDERDGLYWDNMHRSGRIDRRKYSYNSAVMIRADCLMFEITKDKTYLDRAHHAAESAVARWIDAENGAMRDSGRFAHMLLEALVHVDPASGETRWRDTVQKSVGFLHDKLRDSRGHYPNRWDDRARQPLETLALIDQASVARAYFFAAAACRDQEQR